MVILGHKDGSIEKVTNNLSTQTIKGYKAHTVIGGEFAVSSDGYDVAFKTLLGSCVAIMFYDTVKKIKAMNHFLLPSTNNSNEDMKYGLYSVEAMLNEMYKLGCEKKDLRAKISGGADIMQLMAVNNNSIGHRNVEFAKDFCRSEGFEIISEHTRGEHARLILMTNDFETFIKVTNKNETDSKVIQDEKSLQVEITKAPVLKEYVGAVDLFDSDTKQPEQEMEIELF